jgi:YjjI family glycine radical enzyme
MEWSRMCKEEVLKIVKDQTITYEQKVLSLARAAEDSLEVLNIPKETQDLRDEGIICDLFEGHAPYRPRYIVPDYEKFMKQGSKFLELDPPEDIWEATHNLLILYKHVPSITSFPVYIGNIDELLEPFVKDEDEAYRAIKLFIKHIDRTLTDSFCHANIGPRDTIAGRLILKAQREMQTSIPNITIKYSKSTPERLALDSIETAMITAKPSFANDEMYRADFGGEYAIVSCYNGLYIGGGSYTLVRLNLADLAKKAKSKADFFERVLPNTSKLMADYINERIRFLVDESGFFESSFLIREGLIEKDRFSAMFGVFGLAEGTNALMKMEGESGRFGNDSKADELGLEIIDSLAKLVDGYESPNCKISNKKLLMHSQVGIDSDIGISPGCRIPIGEEPELPIHIKQSAKFHKYFTSGIGDIFAFDETAKGNTKFIQNIIDGSFKEGMRYFSLYGSDADVIRITGYLVKKSEIEKLDKGNQVLRDTVVLGQGSVRNNGVLDRKVRKI